MARWYERLFSAQRMAVPNQLLRRNAFLLLGGVAVFFSRAGASAEDAPILPPAVQEQIQQFAAQIRDRCATTTIAGVRECSMLTALGLPWTAIFPSADGPWAIEATNSWTAGNSIGSHLPICFAGRFHRVLDTGGTVDQHLLVRDVFPALVHHEADIGGNWPWLLLSHRKDADQRQRMGRWCGGDSVKDIGWEWYTPQPGDDDKAMMSLIGSYGWKQAAAQLILGRSSTAAQVPWTISGTRAVGATMRWSRTELPVTRELIDPDLRIVVTATTAQGVRAVQVQPKIPITYPPEPLTTIVECTWQDAPQSPGTPWPQRVSWSVAMPSGTVATGVLSDFKPMDPASLNADPDPEAIPEGLDDGLIRITNIAREAMLIGETHEKIVAPLRAFLNDTADQERSGNLSRARIYARVAMRDVAGSRDDLAALVEHTRAHHGDDWAALEAEAAVRWAWQARLDAFKPTWQALLSDAVVRAGATTAYSTVARFRACGAGVVANDLETLLRKQWPHIFPNASSAVSATNAVNAQALTIPADHVEGTSLLAVGKPVPQSAMTHAYNLPTSGTVALSALRGQVVLIEFWNIGCRPCVDALPKLQGLWNRYRDRGLMVIAHSDDTPARMQAFIAKEGSTFPITLGPDRGSPLGIHAIPCTLLIDRNGLLSWKGHPNDLSDDMIEALMAQRQ